MDWIEVTARTVDDAKELALDRLGIVEDELEYEVLDERKSRLFGIGRSEARIRARVKPISRDKPTDRRRRRKPGERSGSSRGSRGSSSGGGANKSGTNGGENAGGTAERSGSGAGESRSRNRRSRGGRGRSGGGTRTAGAGGGSGTTGTAAARRPETESAPEPSRVDEPLGQSVESTPEVDVESVPISTQAEHATKFTENLVRTMGFTATVRTEIDDEDITVHVDGDGLGALVGPRGVTLQALEEVVRAVVQHHAGGHSAWVHVDVSGYRERRREALVAFARKIADEVKETGETKALEPMGAPDRKVVHDVIAEIDGVTTSSEGEDPRRRVVIRPA